MKLSVSTRVDIVDLATCLAYINEKADGNARSRSDIVSSAVQTFATYIKETIPGLAFVNREKAATYLIDQGFVLPKREIKKLEKKNDSTRRRATRTQAQGEDA